MLKWSIKEFGLIIHNVDIGDALKRKGDFSGKTKDKLMKRAGNNCSFCGIVTTGPSTKVDESTNIGETAHIYGIGSSTARYDPNKTPKELKHISNGIWLCSKCHKLIDDDELTKMIGTIVAKSLFKS